MQTYSDLLKEQALERAMLLRSALALNGWVLGRTARVLGMRQSTLHKILSRADPDTALGAVWAEYRTHDPKRGRPPVVSS